MLLVERLKIAVWDFEIVRDRLRISKMSALVLWNFLFFIWKVSHQSEKCAERVGYNNATTGT